LTLDQAKVRLAVNRNFPALRETPPGSWSHGLHERNVRNLWRILTEESPPSQPERGKDQNPAQPAARQ
jgi:hypothetical protein